MLIGPGGRGRHEAQIYQACHSLTITMLTDCIIHAVEVGSKSRQTGKAKTKRFNPSHTIYTMTEI